MKKIVVNKLKYRYPLTLDLALNDISFEVKKGEFVGVVGKNLAGKSTLCQALVGLVPHFYKGAYSGSVEVCGMNVLASEISELSRKIGIVFQNPFTQVTAAKLTVHEEIAFGLENLGIERKEMLNRIEYVLKLLDIHKFRNRNPFELSGGQMQRLAIASIIAMKPEIIVLDEPTSQLDPQGSEEVFKAVQSLSRQGITIIMVEQKVEKLAQYTDRIILMNDGKIVDIDIPGRIFSREDLLNYGVQAPVFTRACRLMNISYEDKGDLYPVTLDETYALMGKHGKQNRS
jgi:energy-coupling factor transport system ATP-binding protein